MTPGEKKGIRRGLDGVRTGRSGFGFCCCCGAKWHIEKAVPFTGWSFRRENSLGQKFVKCLCGGNIRDTIT